VVSVEEDSAVADLVEGVAASAEVAAVSVGEAHQEVGKKSNVKNSYYEQTKRSNQTTNKFPARSHPCVLAAVKNLQRSMLELALPC
jgi:hypothetical protein